VAVFFLTQRTDGARVRFAWVTDITSSANLDVVQRKQRFELDSGFYHLGSAHDPQYSDYVSDLTYLEGFYWHFLNARDYSRLTWSFPLAPATDGTVKVTTHLATLTAMQAYNPEHRIDASVNGAEPNALVADGYGTHTITSVLPANRCPAGSQSIKIYATGIDSLRSKRDYLSQCALEAIEINADVLPVLESGALCVHVPARQQNTSISWLNSQSQGGWWIDTTTRTVGRITAQRPADMIRGGLSPQAREWTNLPNEPATWRGTAMFNNVVADADTFTVYVMMEWSPTTRKATVTRFTSETDLISHLTQAPSQTQVVICGALRAQTDALKTALRDRLLPTTTATSWVVCGVIGVGGSTTGSLEREASGATYRRDGNEATGLAFDTHLPAGDSCVLYVADYSGVDWARAEASRLSNLTNDTSQADMVIIAHKDHREQAERLARHRRLFSGIRVKVVDVDAIIDEFGNGHRQPEALRAYLAWHYSKASQPPMKAALLFGNASWDARLAVPGGNVQSRLPDQVPTYGRPSSDYYFGLLDDPDDRVIPEIIVGRLPVITPSDGRVMVDKIIQSDTADYDTWMRRWYFVGGGDADEGLCAVFQRMLDDPLGSGVTFTDPPLCLDTVTLCKADAPPNAGYYITREINNGVQWMNYVGHGATEQFDITGWEPSELGNTNRYGVLATYACQTGAYSNPSVPCKNAQYLIEPERGFMGAVGGTGWEEVLFVELLHYRVHEEIRDGERYLGRIMAQAKAPLISANNQPSINSVMQFCLLGDPYSRVAMDTKPNIALRLRDVQVVPQQGSAQVTDRDSVAIIHVNILSKGTGTTKPFTVRMLVTYRDTTRTYNVEVDGVCQGALATFYVPIQGRPGEHRLSITADPDGVLEEDTTDNSVTLTLSVLPQSLLPLEPVPYEQIQPGVIHVRQIDPLGPSNQRIVHFAISNTQSLQPTDVLLMSAEGEVIRDGTIIDWDADLSPLSRSGRLWLGSWTETDGEQSAVLWMPFDVNVPNGARGAFQASDFTSLSGASVVYDGVARCMRLADIAKNVFLRSSGIRTSDGQNNPPLEMQIGSTMYVRNEFFRGFNLIVVGQYDTIPRAIRRYDTYRDPLPMEAGHNGFSHDLLKFLRDSVAPDETVLFAVCDESFTGFYADTTMDSLVEVLKEYGSSFADSLAPSSSWAMVGRPGAPVKSATEAWKGAPDSMVTVSMKQDFYVPFGRLTSAWVGPGVAFDSLSSVHDTTGVSTMVYRRDLDGNESLVATVPGNSQRLVFDPPLVATHLRVEWELEHIPNMVDAGRVFGLRTYYQPAHEVLIEPDGLNLSASDVLRGDTIYATASVRNADRRWKVNTVNVDIIHDSTTGGSLSTTIAELAPDTTIPVTQKIVTSQLPSAGNFNVFADGTRVLSEFYRFNNRAKSPLTVREDSIPPVLVVHADAREVRDGEYVPPEPLIEIRLHDNSKLAITDVTRMVVFMNGLRIKEGVVSDFAFLPTDSCQVISSDSTLRAIMRFRYPMEPGQNNLLARVQDATGNSTELEMALFLATENGIARVVPSPNPTTGPTTFNIYVRTPDGSTPSRLRIVDAQGRTVALLTNTVPVASGTLTWNGLTDEGASVSSGVYVWRFELPGSDGGWSVGTTGLLQVLR
jgi:hypothetical protein